MKRSGWYKYMEILETMFLTMNLEFFRMNWNIFWKILHLIKPKELTVIIINFNIFKYNTYIGIYVVHFWSDNS